jgi:hypothetical protein
MPVTVSLRVGARSSARNTGGRKSSSDSRSTANETKVTRGAYVSRPVTRPARPIKSNAWTAWAMRTPRTRRPATTGVS